MLSYADLVGKFDDRDLYSALIRLHVLHHACEAPKDGREVSIDDSAAPIRDVAGVTSGVVVVFRDVTEKRIAEKGLARVQKQLERELSGTRGVALLLLHHPSIKARPRR